MVCVVCEFGRPPPFDYFDTEHQICTKALQVHQTCWVAGKLGRSRACTLPGGGWASSRLPAALHTLSAPRVLPGGPGRWLRGGPGGAPIVGRGALLNGRAHWSHGTEGIRGRLCDRGGGEMPPRPPVLVGGAQPGRGAPGRGPGPLVGALVLRPPSSCGLFTGPAWFGGRGGRVVPSCGN